jgi:outer membrane cobalamin receptor
MNLSLWEREGITEEAALCKWLYSTAGLLLVIALLAPASMAGVSGKISGVVETAEGNPIVGATVRVVGTNLGTTADMDGEYFIINVPSGNYDIAVSSVGFETMIQKDVRVLVDLTTPVDFAIQEVTIDLGQEIIIYAENPVIQQDLTASKMIFTADRLKSIPNIETVQAVLTNYPGVVVGPDQDIHVRGGRSGQISYYYDGFSVQDPFVASQGIRIIPSALEELSLTSGGFTAEYGEALSGVVNAVTPEGGSQYHGGVKWYEGATHPYSVSTGEWGSIEGIGNRAGSMHLSGPIPGFDPKRYTFFAAGEWLADPGSLPHNDVTKYTGTMKIAMQPVPKMKLKANLTQYKADGEVYSHRDVNGVSYDFNTDGLPIFNRNAYLTGFTGSYAAQEHLVLTASFSRFYTMTKSAPEHLFDTYWSEWPGYSENADGDYDGSIHLDNYAGADAYDPTNVYHVSGFTTDSDFDPTYRKRESAYNGVKFSVLSQMNKTNEVKAGFEYRQYDIFWDFKQFFNSNPYGEKYTSQPKTASFFLQDKIEYDYFVVNAGLRYDWRDADAEYNVTPDESVATYKTADTKSRISPRLGVSFPISEKSVVHFNYGYYYQPPQFTQMYMNMKGAINTGYPLLGNPDLESEETVSYELGLDHLISDNIRLDATAYYKDIKDLVTTREWFQLGNDAPITHYDNGDYGSVKGLDVSFEKLPSGSYLSGSIAYSYMIAAGNGSTSLEPYYTYITSTEDEKPPVTEYPLDFDQRHSATAVIDFRVPAQWSASVLGMPIPGAWGFSFVGRYGSGLPYTPIDNDGNAMGERNNSRLPAHYSVDMRFNKNFPIRSGHNMLSFFVEVDNLFNRRNITNVYSRTGQADNDGFQAGAGLALDATELGRLDALYDHDPQNYSAPRTIRTGLEFNF